MDISNEALMVALAVVTAVVGAGWAIYRFIRGIDKRASEKELEARENKVDNRMKAIEHQQEDIRRDAEKSLKNVSDKFALERDNLLLKIGALEKQVDALSSKQSRDYVRHDEILNDIREVLADVRETVAGFGKDFVTRKEFMEGKRDD